MAVTQIGKAQRSTAEWVKQSGGVIIRNWREQRRARDQVQMIDELKTTTIVITSLTGE